MKHKGILELKKGEEILPFVLTEWKTKKYPDGKVTFRFKVLGKKRKDGSVKAVWIENQKRGILKKFFKRVNSEYEFKNEDKYNQFLNKIRQDFTKRFGMERTKIYEPEDMIVE